MPLPPTESLRVVRYAQGFGYSAREWQQALAAPDWTMPGRAAPERLKLRSGDCTVWAARLRLGLREHDVVIKINPLPTVFKLVQSWVGLTKPFRQWRGAELLVRANVRVAPCHAILRSGTGYELLVLSRCPGQSLLTHIRRAGLVDMGAAASAVAAMVHRMNAAHLHNADPKPSNIILDRDRHGDFRACFTDTDSIRRARHTLAESTARFLMSLHAECVGSGLAAPVELEQLIARAVYAIEHPTHAETPAAASWSDRVIKRASELVAAHGDPTPRDDPFAA